MAKATKSNRKYITLTCITCLTLNTPGVSKYITIKNKKTTPLKLKLQKYCKYCKKHTSHQE